jgi:D-alanyl-lipoteichoic acid acyltransferase DltB (MBOAT superfamily)
MTFTETPFWILTVIVFALWLACRKHYAARMSLLLTASVVFYGYHCWWLLFLILAYCVVNWAVGCRLERSRRPRGVLTLGVVFNLAVLGYWKYTPLLLRTAARWALALDLPGVPAPPADWVIPFGISFYAFTGIAYMVDVYRHVTSAERNFLRYTLSVMFFPHLVAGPILRPDDFLMKLRPEVMPDRPEAPLEAFHLLARGFFKKMVLADRIALAIDPFFVHVGDPSTAGVWALPFVYLYALQIYFDFSGYTDIARGLGLLFGFRWPDNFSLPYLARSVQDFWRRWHMTLSRFLKDYLYIPLGGSRRGRWRTCLNLMITMLLGGLWHGASWSFMLWGGLHGAYLVGHQVWSGTALAARLRERQGVVGWLWGLASWILTFHCVCLAWCFFRLTQLPQSLACVRMWFACDADKVFIGGTADLSLWLLLGMYAALGWAAQHLGKRPAVIGWQTRPDLAPLARGFLWGTAVTLLVLAVLLSPGGEAPPFIYFQF